MDYEPPLPKMQYLQPHNALNISMHEFGMTSAKNNKFILGTHALGPCIGLAIYNPSEKTAYLAHFDAATPLSEVDKAFAMMRKNPNTPLEVHMNGGYETSKEQKDAIRDKVKAQPNVTLNMHEDAKWRNLAINAMTGEVETDFPMRLLYPGHDAAQRHERLMKVLGKERPLFEIKPKNYDQNMPANRGAAL